MVVAAQESCKKCLNIHQNVELVEKHKDGLLPFLTGLCPFKRTLTEKKVDKYLMEAKCGRYKRYDLDLLCVLLEPIRLNNFYLLKLEVFSKILVVFSAFPFKHYLRFSAARLE